jgi:transposase
MDTSIAGIKERFDALRQVLDERSRRLLVAAESLAIGRGGISLVWRATGISRQVIRQGVAELKHSPVRREGRIRRPGGGRKRMVDKHPKLGEEMERLVEPLTRGDPESPLRWTCKSVRRLAEELGARGYRVSYPVVAELLHELGYSLPANRKTKEGDQRPDRNAQFEHISQKVQRFMAAHQPVISVDTKKKELVGDFKNGGQEWQPQGQPVKVRVHDFIIRKLGKATPHGIYDLAHNTGWVSVGVDHDTATFAVESIRRWWYTMGRPLYERAARLLITAGSGGSNGARIRLWKVELQRLANETGLRIAVCHFPPGTRKWNKIEHRLFSFISQNWRGKPLTSLGVIVSLVAATTTRTGRKVHSERNTNAYPTVRVSKAEMANVRLRPDRFHGDWNYEIRPERPKYGNVIS